MRGAWTVNANTNHSFKAIYLNIGTTTVSSIQNNAIRNFSYNTTRKPGELLRLMLGL
jgi:hypothetical protein